MTPNTCRAIASDTAGVTANATASTAIMTVTIGTILVKGRVGAATTIEEPPLQITVDRYTRYFF